MTVNDERVHSYMTILVPDVGLINGEYPSVLIWDYVPYSDEHSDVNYYLKAWRGSVALR